MKHKLKEVCDFYAGTGFPVKFQGEQSGEFPFYKVSDIAYNVSVGNVYMKHCNNYISSDVVKEIKGCIIPKDVVVFAKIGEALKLNRRAITSCDCLIDNNAMGISVKQDALKIRYFYYFMRYLKMETLSESTTVPSVRKSALENYLINVPSIDEQNIISERLDTLQSIITHRRTQLEKLDELVKARFVEMFGDPVSNPMGWQIKPLKELSTLITNGNTPKGGSENYVDSGIVFLRSQNVWRNRIDLSDVAYIDEATNQKMRKSIVKHKDILITKTGRINTENSSLGRAALYLGEDDSANINGHVYLVRLNDTVIPEFVVTILTGEAYRKYIRKVCVGGIDKRQINLDQVEDFPIILPPIEQQKAFAAFSNQLDKSKVAVQKALDEAQLLFDSLMQEYFG